MAMYSSVMPFVNWINAPVFAFRQENVNPFAVGAGVVSTFQTHPLPPPLNAPFGFVTPSEANATL